MKISVRLCVSVASKSVCAPFAGLHGRDDAHAKIGGVGSRHFGGLRIALRTSNQTPARMGIPNDSKQAGHALMCADLRRHTSLG